MHGAGQRKRHVQGKYASRDDTASPLAADQQQRPSRRANSRQPKPSAVEADQDSADEASADEQADDGASDYEDAVSSDEISQDSEQDSEDACPAADDDCGAVPRARAAAAGLSDLCRCA